MQIAMLTMAVDQAEANGFTLAITPTLVRPEVHARHRLPQLPRR